MHREPEITENLRSKLEPTTRVVVLTGAGISAESGVPTFRGEDGLWKKFRPEELATVDAFMSNPRLVWEWYEFRRRIIQKIEPNPAHYTLVEFQKFFRDFTLVTQNVDGLHQRAGSTEVVELHGNIARNKCVHCGKRYDDPSQAGSGNPPKCACGGSIRPDVVWFGEALPGHALDVAYGSSASCDLFFCVGTSAAVHPAASLPLVAKRGGAYVVEINTTPTQISGFVDEILLGKAGEVLPKLGQRLKLE